MSAFDPKRTLFVRACTHKAGFVTFPGGCPVHSQSHPTVARHPNVAMGQQRTIAKTQGSCSLDCIAACIHFTRSALMQSPDLDQRLVRYPYAVPYKDRQQCDRNADERRPDEEPDEAGILDHEAREPSQNAARKGAERGQQDELARRMVH